MVSNTFDNYRIFCALIRRDLKVFASRVSVTLLDAVIPMLTQLLNFGYFFPLLGMPAYMIAPVYLGSMVSLFLQLGFAILVRISSDMKNNRYIDYQCTLPISKVWLFAAYIVSSMLEIAFIALPLIASGLFIIRDHISFASTNWLALLLIIFLNLLFFATFFIACAFHYEFKWLLDNFWPRRNGPLFCFSAALVIWSKAYLWSPVLGTIMLFSPFTYTTEGLRSALLGSQDYISPLLCSIALLVFIGANLLVLTYSIKKRLDPV